MSAWWVVAIYIGVGVLVGTPLAVLAEAQTVRDGCRRATQVEMGAFVIACVILWPLLLALGVVFAVVSRIGRATDPFVERRLRPPPSATPPED